METYWDIAFGTFLIVFGAGFALLLLAGIVMAAVFLFEWWNSR